MDVDVVSLEAVETVHAVLTKMLEHTVWSVVVTRNGLPEGVVTERDVLRRCIGKGLDIDRTKAGEIMTSPLLSISPEASIGEAMEEMARKNIRRLYVVENGRLIGRVTQTEVLRSAFEAMETLFSVA